VLNVFIALGIGLALGGVIGWLRAARRGGRERSSLLRFCREAAQEISQTRSVWVAHRKFLRPERTQEFRRPVGTEFFCRPTRHVVPG